MLNGSTIKSIEVMILEEIKKAVLAGKKVCVGSPNYQVIQDSKGQWLIQCQSNKACFGLTWADEKTLNEPAEDFYIHESI